MGSLRDGLGHPSFQTLDYTLFLSLNSDVVLLCRLFIERDAWGITRLRHTPSPPPPPPTLAGMCHQTQGTAT